MVARIHASPNMTSVQPQTFNLLGTWNLKQAGQTDIPTVIVWNPNDPFSYHVHNKSSGALMYNFQMANRRLTFAHPNGHEEGAIFAFDREIHLDGSKYLYNASFGGNIVDVPLGSDDLVFTPNVSFRRHSLSGTSVGTSSDSLLQSAYPLSSDGAHSEPSHSHSASSRPLSAGWSAALERAGLRDSQKSEVQQLWALVENDAETGEMISEVRKQIALAAAAQRLGSHHSSSLHLRIP